MPGKKVTVNRGDGHLFKMTEKGAAAFVSANARAFIVGRGTEPVPAPDRVEVETGGNDAPPPPVSLHDMTVGELIEYAGALEPPLRLPRAPKAELVALIEAHQAGANPEEK